MGQKLINPNDSDYLLDFEELIAISPILKEVLKEEDSFEEYMAVQNKRENLKVLINDKNDKINNVQYLFRRKVRVSLTNVG